MAKLALQGNDAGTGTFTLRAPATNLNRNLVLPDVDGTLSTMEQVKLPIGSFMWFTGSSAPEAFIVADGQLRSRAAFPDLWAFAQASGNISVDDASWDEGQYSPGDGSTTFRVPKVDDRFIRGKSATRAVGLVEEDAIRNITGTCGAIRLATAGQFPTGAFTGALSGVAISNYQTSVLAGSVEGFDASNVVPTADENRPKALTMLPCIKAYDVISDPNVLNAVGVVNEISRLESEKLRKDENINLGVSVAASGTAVDFVGIPEGVNRITVMLGALSTNGTSNVILQVRTANGLVATGYAGGCSNQAGTVAANSNGFIFSITVAASDSITGNLELTKTLNNPTQLNCTGCVFNQGASARYNAGAVTPPLDINGLRITTVNGTDTFDAGMINISWEF